MSGYFVSLYHRLFPKQERVYLPEVVDCARVANCDPSRIFWCEDCGTLHEDFYERT